MQAEEAGGNRQLEQVVKGQAVNACPRPHRTSQEPQKAQAGPREDCCGP